ncbi:MAG: helix-turn-helix domain-containing protein [Planctomycetota bacterium]
MSKLEPMLTMADIAAKLQRSIRTIRQWRAEGFLPRPDLVHGKTVLWRESTLAAWLDEQAQVAQ